MPTAVVAAELDGKLIKVPKGALFSTIAAEQYGFEDLWQAIWYATNEVYISNDKVRLIEDPNKLQSGQWVFVPKIKSAITIMSDYGEYQLDTKNIYYWQLTNGRYHVLHFSDKHNYVSSARLEASSPQALRNILDKGNLKNLLNQQSGNYIMKGNYLGFQQSPGDAHFKGVFKGNTLYLSEFDSSSSAPNTPRIREYQRLRL